MAAPTFTAKVYSDFLGGLEGGQNSGVSPLLLDKNQIAFGINASLRGGFIKTRPPFFRKILDFNDTVLQSQVLSGTFQGGGYYRPDYGTESLIAQISGRLLQFVEQTDGTWLVNDVSVPNDLNSVSSSQVWLWQSEKWMIVTDGTIALPIFFDGTSSRRSYGASRTIANAITFNPAAPPAIGDAVTVTLDVPYTGIYGIPIIFNGEFYEPVQNIGGYPAVLTNINNLSGTLAASTNNEFVVQPNPITSSVKTLNSPDISGAQVTVNNLAPAKGSFVSRLGAPVYLGAHLGTLFSSAWLLPVGFSITINLDNPFIGAVGAVVNLGLAQDITVDGNNVTYNLMGNAAAFTYQGGGSAQWTVATISPDGKTLTMTLNPNHSGNSSQPPPANTGAFMFGIGTFIDNGGGSHNVTAASKLYIPSGQTIQTTATQPAYPIGKLTADVVIPANGASTNILIDSLYSGLANQLVSWGNLQFQISPAPNPTPGTTLILINLSDTSTANYTNPTPLISVPELPAGRMGTYGMGRNWVSLVDGISYLAGDIVGGGSGTPANNFRDAVLKITENTFLAGGGVFRLPGSGDIITAMRFTANLDASLGQGPLQIGTPFSMFSNNAPVHRGDWEALTNPIQSESLIDRGPAGQNSTILVNSDVFFRATDGYGSLVLARRDFNTWGNKAISNEMQRPLNDDDQSLLSYGSAINFKNRFLSACSPLVSAQGIIHEAMVSLNFDLISSLRKTLPPAWEGIFTGLNILQIITGRVNGTIRAFAFTLNLDTNQIELYEMLPETTSQYLDNGVTPIGWLFETKAMFNEDVKPLTELIQLRDGECYISNIKGSVHIKVMYRPDFMECWTTWREFDVCQTQTASTRPGYRTRIGFGEPSGDACEPGNNRPLRLGYFFQFRVEITGSCTWNGMRVRAITCQQPEFAPIECNSKPCQDIECDTTDDLRYYALQGLPPLSPPPAPTTFPFHNNAITVVACPNGLVQFQSSPPVWIQATGGNLTALANTFGGFTQSEADTKATTALNNFIQTNITSGNMTCFAVSCTFSPTTLSGVLLNTAYSQQIKLAGIIQGIWSVAAGSLPPGLTLSASGLISGTPTQSGQFNVIINVNGPGINCNQNYNILVYENMLTNFIEYFTLNETGNANRVSTGGASGQPFFTSGGGPCANVAGVLGSAFLDSFPTGGNFLTGLNALLNPQECFNGVSFSLSIWVNRLTAISGTAFLWTNRKFETEGCQLYFDTPTQFKFDVRNNLGVTNASTYITLPTTNQWNHYTVTFDTTTQVLSQYLNGVLVTTQTGFLRPTMTEPARRMTVGTVFGGGASPMFACQAIGIWNTVLTVNQVLHLYNNGAGIAYPF